MQEKRRNRIQDKFFPDGHLAQIRIFSYILYALSGQYFREGGGNFFRYGSPTASVYSSPTVSVDAFQSVSIDEKLRLLLMEITSLRAAVGKCEAGIEDLRAGNKTARAGLGAAKEANAGCSPS